MKYLEFAKYVGYLSNPNFAIGEEQLLHASMGLVTESAECLDILKKCYAYHRPFDVDKFKDELGDVLHYLTMASNTLGISIEDLMDINYAKLSVRYPDGYSDNCANNRDVVAEQKAIKSED